MNKQKLNIKNIAIGSTMVIGGVIGINSSANFMEKQFSLTAKNSTEEKLLEVVLNEGDNITDLTNNPDGYTKITVRTVGDKKLDTIDFQNLALSGIPSIDLSNSKADSIPVNAFSSKTWLKTFIFPSGLINIGNRAFYGCNNLSDNLNIPDTVQTIGEYAFYNCSKLIGDLVIPNSVTSIGQYSFYKCQGLNGTISLGNSLTSIPKAAFAYCTGLTGDLFIPNSVTSIATESSNTSTPFYKCDNLNGELTIGSGIKEIKKYMFGETSFTKLTISEGVESIGNYAFDGCHNFKDELNIPSSVISIGNYAFRNCYGFTGDLVIPDTVTSLGNSVFSSCYGFDGNLVIGSGISSIPNNAFTGCSKLSGSLNIPQNIISIGNSAFTNCYRLTGDLVIPDNVTTIGESVFYRCEGFNGNLIIGKGLTNIPESAFTYCSSLIGDLIIPDNITSIASESLATNRPFYKCDNLNGKLIIGSGIKEIKQYMFAETSFSELIMKEGVQTIGNYAFDGCSNFKGDLIIPSSVTSIGNYAFRNCSGFDNDLILGKGILSLGTNPFSSTYNIKRIFIATGEDFADSNFRKDIIDKLQKSKLTIDIPYDFNIENTWLENETEAKIVKPVLKKISNNIELDFDNSPSNSISLFLDTAYKEEDIIYIKDGCIESLPTPIDNKYIFDDNGNIELSIKTLSGAISNFTLVIEGNDNSEEDDNITDEGNGDNDDNAGDDNIEDDNINEDFDYVEAEKIVEELEELIETNSEITILDFNRARDLINRAPEGPQKEELQKRLDSLMPTIELERKNSSANLDIYIKSENMLSLSLDTNSVTFEDFSGVEDLTIPNAIEITINSSLPYDLNAYMPSEIQNSDGTNKVSFRLFNIKESNSNEYKQFENTIDKIVLKEGCHSGKNIVHNIDLKLASDDAIVRDIYKTTIKFEATQK
ncbi:MAG: leucine-rich repeat domain-containing protein [Clostridium sp.]|nr:leucine-rich repeat domain-containing protein [Clostridium sp.]MBQ9000048.1 leucine-rich repeat domain-containing protein [Clostridium sp.]